MADCGATSMFRRQDGQDAETDTGTSRRALRQALDEFSAQVSASPASELLGTEDLEWSFEGPDRWWVFVDAKRQGVAQGRLALTLTATARSRHSSRVRSAQTREITARIE